MINTELRQALKAQAHHLKPIIIIGSKGLTPAVVAETNVAIDAHELLKVKINGAEKKDRIIMADNLCEQLPAELVQLIGSTAIIYRKKVEKK